MESSAILSSNSLFPIPAEQHSLLPRRAPFGEHLQQPLQPMATTGCGKKGEQMMNFVRISEPGRRFFKGLMEEEEEEEEEEEQEEGDQGEERSMRQVMNLVRISEPGRRFFKDLMEEEEEEQEENDRGEKKSMRQMM